MKNASKPKQQPPFLIGQLSERTGCNIENIRYYEREGLLPAPPRSDGGQRLYDEEHLKRLTFIRRSRELGFAPREVRGLLEMVDREDFTCDEVHGFTINHLTDVRGKISDLRRLERVLKKMAAECSGGTTPDCPILDTLMRT
jgi:MerR family mercuric resistance operon transcriptional regulator